MAGIAGLLCSTSSYTAGSRLRFVNGRAGEDGYPHQRGISKDVGRLRGKRVLAQRVREELYMGTS